MTPTLLLEPTILPASKVTTYKVGGTLLQAYSPTTVEQLLTVLRELHPQQPAPPLVLGWGSNTLVGQVNLNTPCLVLRQLSGMSPLPNSPTTAEGVPLQWRILAGTHLAQVANETVKHGLSGGEFFIGIPGTLGGALVMNAGAMGQETAPLLLRVRVFDWLTGEDHWLAADRLSFDYRYSNLDPARTLILEADLAFTAGHSGQAKARMQANVAFRKAHHPTEPNGGSVFRNPTVASPMGQPAIPAGQLVDELGGKGVWRVGDALISPKHGNFIINMGNATASDVLGLMQLVQTKVFEATGHKLHPENKLLGFDSKGQHATYLTDNEVTLYSKLIDLAE